MAQYATTNHDGKICRKCRLNLTFPLGEAAVEALLAMRKELVAHRDAMLTTQKECGARGDREGAKFFKGEAADAMKQYRAACLLIPHIAVEHPGDCKLQPAWDWPPDLFDDLDLVMNFVEAVI